MAKKLDREGLFEYNIACRKVESSEPIVVDTVDTVLLRTQRIGCATPQSE